MAVEWGLLQSAGAIPMRASAPDIPDLPKEAQQVYSMAGEQAKAQTAVEGMQDRAALQNYLKSGGDIYTPTGVDKALQDLKGQISPDTYMKLGEHSRGLKEADVKFKEMLSKFTDQQLAAYDAGLERSMPLLASLNQGYEKMKAEKGEQAAAAWFNDQRGQLVPQLQSQQVAPGIPMFNPQVIDTIGKMTPDQLPAVIRGSQYQSQQSKAALDAARAREAEAKARVYEETGSLKPGSTEMYVDSAGNKYSVTKQASGKVDVIRNGVDKIDVGQLPSDVKKLGTKGASDMAGAAALKPDTLQFLADYTATTGKNFPVPSFGAANNAARAMYLNTAAELAQSRGYSGTEAGQVALSRDASREALKRMRTQSAQIETGERDMQNVITVLKDELKKLGGPDSPKVRQFWNKASTEWAGDPDFTGVNAAWANFQETAARVFSGQTGAGGTPVNYLKLVQDSVGQNPNLEQVYKLEDTMGKLFTARKKAVQDTERSLIASAAMTPKTGSAAKSEEDGDRAAIIRSEYDKAVAAVDAAKSPDERRRALEDVRSTRSELKKLGVDVPDIGAEKPAAKPDAPKEGATGTSKSGKAIIFRNGKWEYR